LDSIINQVTVFSTIKGLDKNQRQQEKNGHFGLNEKGNESFYQQDEKNNTSGHFHRYYSLFPVSGHAAPERNARQKPGHSTQRVL